MSQDRILTALKDARTKLEAVEREKTEPIAVIGAGCRFPGGADTPDAYWRLLRDGVEAMVDVPADRWSIDEYFDPDPDAPGKMYVRDGGFVDSIDRFDPQFFRISPREAVSLDPQQRLLLEVVWEALENAGQSADRIRGSQTGIFMGLSWHDYERLVFGIDPTKLDAYAGMGNTPSIAVGRLAFFLGVHGPVAQLDTACSASLVSVHQACQALRTRECTMALAGGVNLMISPMSTVFCCKIKALSPTGRCHTFDAAADGYARGEGCGVVVLKRLSDAIADGDSVLALVRGSAINHDGPSSGLTVPNRRAQRDVIRKALASARIAPADVAYVEAHGTGTSLGDPIEVGALGDALAENRPEDRPLHIGSVKTNFGHLEAAAGIAGFIKAVLALQHGEIPPHLQFVEPSPNIDWEQFPVRVPTERTPWPAGPRIAGVSSFGFSGTNAHVVLEAAPERPWPDAPTTSGQVVTLAAKAEDALPELAQRYADHVTANPGTSLADIAFTTNTGRAHFDHRLAVVADDHDQLADRLRAFAAGTSSPGIARARASEHPRVAFLFTGQGAQYPGMGRELFETEPVFRAALERCDEILRPRLEQPLLELLYEQPETSKTLSETAYTQPSLFAIEYALAELWKSWGVVPDLVMGHSVGEYVAACLAGVFSLEDGLNLIAERGRLMQALPRDGDMVAVFADEARVEQAIESMRDDVSIASINGPTNVVISGKREAVQAAVASLASDDVKTHQLDVSHAFHSPLMEPMLAEFEKFAAGMSLSRPQTGLVSNVTGELATEAVTNASYWRRHVREPVRFAASMAAIAEKGCELFVELGPQPHLLGMGRHCVPANGSAWLPSLRRGQPDRRQILDSLAELHVRGVPVDWDGFHGKGTRRRVALPTYPFQRQRYWVETDASRAENAAASIRGSHPLLDRRVHAAGLKRGAVVFESQIGLQRPTYLADHHVFDVPIPPATLYHEMALAAGSALTGSDAATIESVVIHQPLLLQGDAPRTLQCVLIPEANSTWSYEVFSLERAAADAEPRWTLHATGRVGAGSAPPARALRNESGDTLDIDECYDRFVTQGLALGPSFQAIRSLQRRDNAAFGELQLPESLTHGAKEYLFHPVLMDACGQAVASAFPPDEDDIVYLPVGVDRMRVYGRAGARIRFQARLTSEDIAAPIRTADIQVFDESGSLVAEIEGATTQRAPRESVLRALRSEQDWLYAIDWQAGDELPATEQVTAGRWLVFADAGGTGAKLAESLRSRGDECELVSIDASDPDQIARALPGADATTRPNRGIVCLAGLDTIASDTFEVADLLAAQPRGCGAALRLVQALVAAQWPDYPPLCIVTRGTQPVGGPVDPVHAALSGLGRTVALEHPELHCVRVDLDPAAPSNELETLVAELDSVGAEREIAHRDGQRYVARLGRPTDHSPGAQADIQPEVSYLITGGLGALGLKVAGWLASRGAQHLVLVGRRPPSESATQSISELEQAGVQVTTVPADIAEPADVARVLETIAESDHPLRGIVHAAGVLADGALLGQTWERFADVMAPKVAGAWNLHTATLDLPIDFFVCFSSAASMLGSRGQGGYASANAFLDALAHHRRGRNLPALSINWGPWGEVGMAADMDERAARRMYELGWEEIPPDTGMQLLDQLLAEGSAQRGVLPLDFTRFVEQFPAEHVPPYYPVSAVDGSLAKTPELEDGFLDRLLELNSDERRERMVRYLQEHTARIVGLDPNRLPAPQDSFTELGVDSLMHMELRNHVVTELSTNIPMGEFISRSDIGSLAELLLENLSLASVTLSGPPEPEESDEEMEEFTL